MSANDPKRTLASPKSRNAIYGISGWPYSGFMLAVRITLPHFSVSSAMSLPKSAGEPASTRLPRSALRLDFQIGKRGVNLPIELVDDFGGCVFGRADARPPARLVARHKFADGRDSLPALM